ncbi:thioredoxin-like fold domain-containing protein MRL7L homolog, chloroplastic [Phragmites australis]|uniref:thioredoxin-like fold domain-containing protein MRL7L homolog, chloroplastic n=1 Tax=Phragmites australis TaxID=29695 RepID=UPI002D79BBBB|nr:thioredoxin-like fold domain-containing protein MRL7L homolog, chloroplastic [Phragmites australis]
MALRCSLPATCSAFCLKGAEHPDPSRPSSRVRAARFVVLVASLQRRRRLVVAGCARAQASDSKAVQLVLGGRACGDDTGTDSEPSDDEAGDGADAEACMTDEERRTLRRKIREMMDRVPETAGLTDPEERKAKMRELLTKYELVVEEEDPDWPEDAEDGMGFSLGQFFDKITIKAEKKDEEEEGEDKGYQSDKEIVWEDDNYIKPIRDVKTQDWDASVFTDFGPMIVLVHNRYKRPQENDMARAELTKAIEMFWEHNLPSPRCVAVDACAEPDLVDALKVSNFPEILFTNAGRIIHREKVVRSAEAWSRMMAFFYYKAARPPFLCEADGQGQEKVPLMS